MSGLLGEGTSLFLVELQHKIQLLMNIWDSSRKNGLSYETTLGYETWT